MLYLATWRKASAAPRSRTLEIATATSGDFISRARQVKQRNSATRPAQPLLCPEYENGEDCPRASAGLQRELTESEQSATGNLGWVARRELAYDNGVAQRCGSETCVADLVRFRGADFKMSFWFDVDGVIVQFAASGHANRSPKSTSSDAAVSGSISSW